MSAKRHVGLIVTMAALTGTLTAAADGAASRLHPRAMAREIRGGG